MDPDKKKFVIRHGVLGWGVPFWLLMSVTHGFGVPNGGPFEFGPFNIKAFWSYALIALPLSLAGGFGFGLIMWEIKIHSKSGKPEQKS